MKTITIQTDHSVYPVVLGEDAIEKLDDIVNQLTPVVTSILLIADETVYKLHKNYIASGLPERIKRSTFLTPAGEKAKSFEVYQNAIGFALEEGLDRHSLVIACGGGATGDLAGFVAATFMRGIRLIQLPTTILAHDSAVGGKVAINHPLGKNMVGSFHQPAAVIYDMNFLHSLPIRESRSGFAEVIKHAIIADPKWLDEMMADLDSLESLDNELLENSLKKGIEIKAAIVEKDEKELGIRAYLNFGHTYGHAIETWAGYGKWSHGESIMAGMVYSLYLSKKLKNLEFDLLRFVRWINKLGYTAQPPAESQFDELLQLMLKDKKTVGKEVRFVLLEKIGKPVIQKIDTKELAAADKMIRSAKGEIK
ncbi:3-dehydroquinate synthase [Jeotgalibacillus campisalis]|uniref:3-dehydroquinate synthase n=1 Tax=Jeotgalibacillus campisalis TaxID=220754 RepID=A0A0C2S226_9BACL|nr:3-dehydroquinate synthase [Jeotgalibacillus campisalis]KIL48059.1 3-dehydroquinate synthase [Jeotgalibacillus campisalis]